MIKIKGKEKLNVGSFLGFINDSVVGILILLALVLRSLSILKPNLIFDEGYTVLSIRGISETGYPVLPSGILYPRGVAYNYLSSFVDLLLKNELASIRIISLIMGVATVFGVYLLSKEIFKSREVAIFNTILASFSYYLIEISKYGRFYSQMLFFFVISFYLTLKIFSGEKKENKNILPIFLLAFTSVMAIFSDTLGISVVFPIGIVILSEIVEKAKTQGKILGAIWSWIEKNFLKVFVLFVFIGGAIILQLYLERNTFYTTYRKLIVDTNAKATLGNVPISLNGVKFLQFLLALFRTFWLETVVFLIVGLGLKLNYFKKGINYRKPFMILSSVAGLLFLLVWVVAPQFQIRYFYIYFVLGLITFGGLLKYFEELIGFKSLIRYAAMIFCTGFLVSLAFYPLEKSFGSISGVGTLPSSSLDYYPDSERAFDMAVSDSSVGTETAILISTYRKELEYYATDFKGMKFVLVPYDLEVSLKSMPYKIYTDYAKKTKYKTKDLAKEKEFLLTNLGLSEEDLLVDPVGGNFVLRPEQVITLSEKAGLRVYVITSRFDYHEKYVSPRYRNFLKLNTDKVIYKARDEGYSDLYLF